MRVIVTRPQGDAENLAARLKALGHEPILSPLLEIAPLPFEIPADAYQFVAFTSANGARAVSSYSNLVHLPVFTVGNQSASAARDAGFVQVEACGGDAVGLSDHIARTQNPNAGPVLYVSGRDSASGFTGLLESSGFDVRRVVAYEARPASALAPAVHEGAAAVMLFSPRTARVWAALVAAEELTRMAEIMSHVCISANAAAVLPDEFPKIVAGQPTDEAMLEALARITSPRR
jgi:uroporphyrinogen-III synthase